LKSVWKAEQEDTDTRYIKKQRKEQRNKFFSEGSESVEQTVEVDSGYG